MFASLHVHSLVSSHNVRLAPLCNLAVSYIHQLFIMSAHTTSCPTLSGLFIRRDELALAIGQPGASGPAAGSRLPVGIPEGCVELTVVAGERIEM